MIKIPNKLTKVILLSIAFALGLSLFLGQIRHANAESSVATVGEILSPLDNETFMNGYVSQPIKFTKGTNNDFIGIDLTDENGLPLDDTAVYIKEGINEYSVLPRNYGYMEVFPKKVVVTLKYYNAIDPSRYGLPTLTGIVTKTYNSETKLKEFCSANLVEEESDTEVLDFLDLANLANRYNKVVYPYDDGDVNGDGIINILDISWVSMYLNTTIPLDADCHM